MGSGMCRVRVEFECGRIDLCLPAELTVAAVIPSIVDHAAAQGAIRRWQEMPTGWQLSHLDGRPLSPRMSLHGNAVCDGDVLVLSRVEYGAAIRVADDAVAQAGASLSAAPRWTPAATRVATSVTTLCCAVLASYALMRSTSSAAPVVSGLLAAVAVVTAITVQRVYSETLTAVAQGVSAVGLSAVTAYLLVPGEAATPRIMLAGAVTATVSIVAAHGIGSGTTGFAAICSFGFLVAAAAGVRVAAAVGVDAAGALLAAGALTVLVLAPRFAIWIARVPVPRLSEPATRDEPVTALRAHAIVTGLVCGTSGAAAVGTFLVTARGDGYVETAFAAATAIALTLRTGTHVDLIQATALLVGGSACLAALLVGIVAMWPGHAHWIAPVVAGVAAVPSAWSSKAHISPVTGKCIELAGYTALASVIPLACWVCGAFAAVRGLRLS